MFRTSTRSSRMGRRRRLWLDGGQAGFTRRGGRIAFPRGKTQRGYRRHGKLSPFFLQEGGRRNWTGTLAWTGSALNDSFSAWARPVCAELTEAPQWGPNQSPGAQPRRMDGEGQGSAGETCVHPRRARWGLSKAAWWGQKRCGRSYGRDGTEPGFSLGVRK